MPAAILGFPPSTTGDAAAPSDPRYRDLAGPADWMRLPAAVRRRFSRRLAAQEQVVYRGEVMLTELSRAGWLLAQAARILGGPIPFTSGATGPSVVAVTEEPALDGQVWTRIYARHGRFPQIIHSAKRFRGPTGLEEDLGHGLLMRLTMHVEDGALVFRSAGYAVSVLARTLRLPAWLSPGRCEVVHRHETDERFSFTLTLEHPLLGRLVRQIAFYEEARRS